MNYATDLLIVDDSLLSSVLEKHKVKVMYLPNDLQLHMPSPRPALPTPHGQGWIGGRRRLSRSDLRWSEDCQSPHLPSPPPPAPLSSSSPVYFAAFCKFSTHWWITVRI